MTAFALINSEYDIASILLALGIDPLEGTYHLSSDSLELEGVTQAALDAVLASYDHLAVMRKRRKAQAAKIAEAKIDNVAHRRRRELALHRWNELNDKRLNGDTLTAQEQDALTAIRQQGARLRAIDGAVPRIAADIDRMDLATVEAFDPATSARWPE